VARSQTKLGGGQWGTEAQSKRSAGLVKGAADHSPHTERMGLRA